jgi:hypothetical protein
VICAGLFKWKTSATLLQCMLIYLVNKQLPALNCLSKSLNLAPMKKIFTMMLLLCGTCALAQDSLQVFNSRRTELKTTGMEVLGGWAVTNMAVGTVGYYNSSGAARSFHQMNIIWNIANLGIATAGYFGARNDGHKTLNAAESLKAQKQIETLFIINGGLDLVYIGSGIYLKNRGDNRNSDKLRGFGSSIIMQGVFLLLFDGVNYSAHKHNGNKLRNFLQKNPITFDGQKVGMLINM